MEYIIIPATLLEGKEEDLAYLSLSPRYSNDKAEIILHVEHYNMLFPSMLSLDEEKTYPFIVYTAPSEAFDTIINSPDWTSNEEIV